MDDTVSTSKVGRFKRAVGLTTEEGEKLKFIQNRITSAAEELRSGNRLQLWDAIHAQNASNGAPQLVLALIDLFQQADAAAISRGQNLDALKQRSEGQDRCIQDQVHEIESKQSEIDNLKIRCSGLAAEKDRMEKQLHDENAHQKAYYESRIFHLGEEHKTEMRNLLQSYQDALNTQSRRHTSETNNLLLKHETEIKNLRQEHEREIQHREEKFDKNIKSLQEAAADQEDRLNKDIQELNVALVSRERFKPISDIVLQRQFSELIYEVDNLARIEWKANNSEWTPEVLQQLSRKTRNLKRQILQDAFWGILFENIFCSPFRIFGQEGRHLESEWNKLFGTGKKHFDDFYNWPEPDLSSERWRYEALQKYQEVLSRPISKHHPSADLKRGFQSTIDAVNQEITATLDKVTLLDEMMIQQIGELTMKAATTWVAFGTQRCRLVIAMHGSNFKSTASKISAALGEDGLIVVEKPDLLRFGNAQGEKLSNQEIVSGCHGETKTLTVV